MGKRETIMLIGCSAMKRYAHDRARGGRVYPHELYMGPLFRKRVRYAELRGVAWGVLSARFGLWWHDREYNPCDGRRDGKPVPYNQCLSRMPADDRSLWHLDVARELVRWLSDHGNRETPRRARDVTVELHAGIDYCEPLRTHLELGGFAVERFLVGYGIGSQLKWYNARLASTPVKPMTSSLEPRG